MAPLTRVIPSAAARATSLLRTIQFTHPPSCPCHSNPTYHQDATTTSGKVQPPPSLFRTSGFRKAASRRSYGTPQQEREYAFEMAASSIRFGPGVTQEVGMDLKNLGAKKVCVVTDENVNKLFAMKQVRESLEREGVEYVVYTGVVIEPKDTSVQAAIEWCKPHRPDAFLAVGGGSVIDTAKLMNLYTTLPAPFLTYVNAPLGQGQPIPHPLKPLIAVPTTSGTGSETTGTAIFDLTSSGSKTGVAHRNLKPLLGICDPLNTKTMPRAVRVSSGLDVLCHALESWTAIPYDQRVPRPKNPINRPAYQGANPISDVFSMHALKRCVEFLPRSVKDEEDEEAQTEMLLAATLAGVGFGNAGVHLCHGMSYPISSQNPSRHTHPGYPPNPTPLIPHGVSVAVTAPAVFRFTAASNPARHLAAAAALGVDTSHVSPAAAGDVLAEALVRFLERLGDQPRGLRDLGFGAGHVDRLVEGTMPQRRVLMLAPGMGSEEGDGGERDREVLRGLFEDSMVHR